MITYWFFVDNTLAFTFNKSEAAEVGAYKCPGGGCSVAPLFNLIQIDPN